MTGASLLLVPGFALTGNMITARNAHIATLLNSGLVLIAGGLDVNSNALASAELYNPATGSFVATGNLNIARANFTATLLVDGTVLIAGGQDSSLNLLASAELYNPTTGTFTLTGSLSMPRLGHTATLLPNGQVLVAGLVDNSNNVSAIAELYDPPTGTFLPTGNLVTARGLQSATLLNDGTVLLSGGVGGSSVLASSEIYDPVAGTFSATGSLNTGRADHTATLLNSGSVLIAGGQDANSNTLATAELYNASAHNFVLTGNMANARGNHAATLLTDGMVLVEGGFGASSDMSASAELYDPGAGTFSAAASLNVARQIQTATLLLNGQPLVAGGFSDSPRALASAELFEPSALASPNLVSIAVTPVNGSIPAGSALRFTATGRFSDNSTQTLASVTWASSSTSVATITNDSGDRGVVLGVAIGSSTISACAGAICGSTNLTVVAPDPDIASLSPLAGPVATSLTISGSGYGSNQGTNTVTVDGIPATVSSWSPTTLVVAVPSGADTGDVIVTIGGVASNLVEFTVLPTPTISSVSPSSGDIGAPIQISGANFGDTQGSSTVTLNGVPVTVSVWSATNITGTVPAGGATGNLVVSVSGVPSNAVSFTVTNVPAIFSLSPIMGPPGTSVIITGADFGASQGTSTVTFNGVQASISNWGAGSVNVVVPAGATTGPVVVNVGGTLSNGVTFVSPGPPNITSLAPNFGIAGVTVTISGSNFGPSQGTSTVSFNGTLATATSWSPTQIVVTVPAAATSGNVTVTSAGVTGAAVFFTVAATQITSVSSTSAQPGQGITIQGVHFGASQGTSTVTFNGVPASVNAWGDQQIAPVVPSTATTGNLVITVNGVAVSAGTFTVVPIPVITSVSPTSGAAGTVVTISGNNFGASPGQVFLACNTTSTVNRWINTSIVLPLSVCTDPGPSSVFLTAIGGPTFSNNANFTVLPNISGISPSSGTVGTQVQINGTSFGSNPGTVTFNGVAATPISWSPTQIVTYPPVGATTGNVVVASNGTSSNGASFTVQPSPVISNLSRTDGIVGTAVTINGSGFGSPQGSSTVTFNGTTASVTGWSSTSIGVTVPSGATSGNVVVTVGGVGSNPVAFTLDQTPVISSFSQSAGSPGTPITIFGSNFLDTQGSSTVTFNGTAATVTGWSAGAISVNVPAATTGNVVVTVLGQASAGVKFTVTAAPNISSLAPASGPAGILVSINGSNFGNPQGTNTVSFNGVSGTPISWTSGLIKVPVPSGATTGPVLVTVNNGPSNSPTFSVTAGPGITSVSPTNAGIGVVVTITGVGFGATQGASTVKFNGTVATPTIWSDSQILVPVPVSATTGNLVVTVGGIASNGIAFTVASGLSVTMLTPNSGNTGEAVVISGNGFGNTQGSSKVTFNGATATVSAWSNTSITVQVPAAATSGPVTVTVGGASSDGVNFTAQPQILAISPNPAAYGVNVTITGENFGATQGNSFVACDGNSLGLANYVSWSASSIVLQSCVQAFGAALQESHAVSVQITVNNVSSAVAAVTGVPDPALTAVTPTSAAVGAPILIRGSNLGSSQGQSTVTINGAAATPTSWSNTAIVVPVPTGAAANGQINVVVAGALAIPRLSFQVATPPAPTSLQIAPTGVNMLIGDTKTFNVVDNGGRPRPDATWSVDNTSLATITASASPTTGSLVQLTAVAAGTVNLTATVQGVSAHIPVVISSATSFPAGTILWSAPPVPGFSPSQIAQAVPSDFGPDVYSIQKSSDGKQTLVQAFTADGQEMWQSTSGPLAASSIPDGFGGLLSTIACDPNDPLNSPLTVQDQDGISGGTLWQGPLRQFSGSTPVCLSGVPRMAVRQDGAVVLAMPLQVTNPLQIFDGQQGITLATPAIPPSSFQNTTGAINSCDCFTPLGQPMVDSGGSVNVRYEVRNISEFNRGGGPPSIASDLWLLTIALDGTTSSIQVASSSSADLFPGNIIPDGQGGMLVTWAAVPIDITAPPLAHPYQAAHVLSGLVTTFDMPMAPTQVRTDSNTGLPTFFPMVLGENGVAFASYGGNIASFALVSGSANWNYQNANGVAFMGYTNGGGLTIVDGQSNLITLDSGGNAGTSTGMPSLSLLQATWTGNWEAAIASSNSGLAAVIAPQLDWGHSKWGAQAGTPSFSGFSVEMPWFPPLPSCPGSQIPCAREALNDALTRLRGLLAPGTCSKCDQWVFNLPRIQEVGIDQRTFYRYLLRVPNLYDGTRSYAPMNEVMCDQGFFTPCDFDRTTVRDYMKRNGSGAISRTPSRGRMGMLTYFDPGQVCADTGSTPKGLENEATIFHEALHGATGYFDGSPFAFDVRLESIFGIPYQPSAAITDYLRTNVLGGGPRPLCP